MEVEQKFAQGLLNALLTHYVPTVIFAGSVALNQPQRLENIGNIIQQHMKLLPPPTLLTSKHGDLIGLYGALGALQKTS
jgi:hypothetical protein